MGEVLENSFKIESRFQDKVWTEKTFDITYQQHFDRQEINQHKVFVLFSTVVTPLKRKS